MTKQIILAFLLTTQVNAMSGLESSVNANVIQNPNQVTINTNAQTSSTTWQNLNVNRNQSLTINQPTNNSLHILNHSGNNPTTWSGNISSNGAIYFQSSGTLNLRGAQINVSSLTANTIAADRSTTRLTGDLNVNNLEIGNTQNAHLLINGDLNIADGTLTMSNKSHTNSRILADRITLNNVEVSMSSEKSSPNFTRLWADEIVVNGNTTFNLTNDNNTITFEESLNAPTGVSISGELIIIEPEIEIDTPDIDADKPTINLDKPTINVDSSILPEFQNKKRAFDTTSINNFPTPNYINICIQAADNTIIYNNSCVLLNETGKTEIIIDKAIFDSTLNEATTVTVKNNVVILR